MMLLSYRDALNQAMREEMRRDEKIFLIGEEVGYYQSAFKVSKGFVEEFGRNGWSIRRSRKPDSPASPSARPWQGYSRASN